MTNHRIVLQSYCKVARWGGLCTTLEKLQSILLTKPDLQEKIVRTELTSYRNTHKMNILWQIHLNWTK